MRLPTLSIRHKIIYFIWLAYLSVLSCITYIIATSPATFLTWNFYIGILYCIRSMPHIFGDSQRQRLIDSASRRRNVILVFILRSSCIIPYTMISFLRRIAVSSNLNKRNYDLLLSESWPELVIGRQAIFIVSLCIILNCITRTIDNNFIAFISYIYVSASIIFVATNTIDPHCLGSNGSLLYTKTYAIIIAVAHFVFATQFISATRFLLLNSTYDFSSTDQLIFIFTTNLFDEIKKALIQFAANPISFYNSTKLTDVNFIVDIINIFVVSVSISSLFASLLIIKRRDFPQFSVYCFFILMLQFRRIAKAKTLLLEIDDPVLRMKGECALSIANGDLNAAVVYAGAYLRMLAALNGEAVTYGTADQDSFIIVAENTWIASDKIVMIEWLLSRNDINITCFLVACVSVYKELSSEEAMYFLSRVDASRGDFHDYMRDMLCVIGRDTHYIAANANRIMHTINANIDNALFVDNVVSTVDIFCNWRALNSVDCADVVVLMQVMNEVVERVTERFVSGNDVGICEVNNIVCAANRISKMKEYNVSHAGALERIVFISRVADMDGGERRQLHIALKTIGQKGGN